MNARQPLLLALLVAARLPAHGTDTSSAAPAPASTPASSHTSFTTTSQAFVPWNQPVINSSPWDNAELDLQYADPRQRWVKHLDESPTSNRFFPPTPPALAEPLSPVLTPLAPHLRADLLDFTAETFYMPYGNVLNARQIFEKRADRIARYRGKRDQLVAELRALLDRAKDLPAPRRTDELRAFSSAQTPRAATLEIEAEAIRDDLTTPGLFRFSNTAYDLARDAAWSKDAHHLGSFAFILPLLGAQYYAGFSADQRLLLHEMTMEQRADAHRSPSEPTASTADYFFFLPSTSRIRLPTDLPPALDDKVRRFRTQKEQLKAELQSALDRDQFRFVAARTEHFTQLARAQAPAFAALETLAEEIRIGLAGIAYPDAPSVASLSADLTERVGQATGRKAALQRELHTRLKRLQAQFRGERIEIVRRGKGLALAAVGPPSSTPTHEQRERLLADIELFNASIGSRYADLADEMDRLRNDLRAIVLPSDQSSSKNVDRLAAEFDRSYKKQEAWKRYGDYYAAVLVPGLSPELRRLLYRAAWTDLFKQQVLASPLNPACARPPLAVSLF